MYFKDRKDAGIQLSEKFPRNTLENYYIFALSSGGVIVAYELSKKLNVPMDIVISLKLRSESSPDIGFGAIAQGKVLVLDEDAVKSANISQLEVNKVKTREAARLSKMIQKYRDNKSMPDLESKTVIIVDDGVITGDTAKAAARYIKSFDPTKIILAAPVCRSKALRNLKDQVDNVVFIKSPKFLTKISECYEDFSKVKDKEVLNLLKKASA